MQHPLACAGRTVVSDITPMIEVSQQRRHPGRGLRLHRQLAHPPVRRGLGPRAHREALRRRRSTSPSRRASRSLRHRGHDALAPRGARARSSRWPSITARARICLCRHRRPRHARRRAQPHQLHARASSPASGADGRHRLARSQRSRPRARERALGARVRRRPRARHGARHRRARRQRADGAHPAQPEAPRPARGAGPHQAPRVLPDGRARAVGWHVPINYPLVGRDAFRTATGVHAAAIIKARGQGRRVARRPHLLAASPPACSAASRRSASATCRGASNVNYWLKQRGIEPTKAIVDAILAAAKNRTTS